MGYAYSYKYFSSFLPNHPTFRLRFTSLFPVSVSRPSFKVFAKRCVGPPSSEHKTLLPCFPWALARPGPIVSHRALRLPVTSSAPPFPAYVRSWRRVSASSRRRSRPKARRRRWPLPRSGTGARGKEVALSPPRRRALCNSESSRRT